MVSGDFAKIVAFHGIPGRLIALTRRIKSVCPPPSSWRHTPVNPAPAMPDGADATEKVQNGEKRAVLYTSVCCVCVCVCVTHHGNSRVKEELYSLVVDGFG